MNKVIEWCFEFSIISPFPKSKHRMLAENLHATAVQWAEGHSLGIGGGFSEDLAKSGSCSHHKFGLTITQENQHIDLELAQKLHTALRGRAISLGAELKGDYHLFDIAD